MKIFSYVFITMILLIFYGATTKSLGWIADLVQSIPYGDKIIHFILIGTLAYVVNYLMGFRRFEFLNRKWLTGTTLIFAIMTIEEFSQMFVSTRSFDLLDLTANYLGIFTATFFIRMNKQDVRKQEANNF